MTENFKGQEQLRTQVSQAVKQALIDTKYADEAISFGQAVVTHHFLNSEPTTAKRWQTAQPYDNRNGARSRSP